MSTRALGKLLKKSGLRMLLPRKGNQYLLSPENIREVVDYQQQVCGISIQARDIDREGLPLEWLADPARREAFTMLRFERERRLLSLIARSGIDVRP
ncbi:hypothetical protein A4G30_16190 [Mycobacterium kansasii]|nr:hypothetical protein B1T51_16415 [Mycobacterium kansasii]ARG81321.1 hypothetical protein B1T52_16875 [Mycobacterium kansasii]ARG93410.1 hypothetical protein B1T50_17285 [Mycobacterium kansasii]KZS76316.1 hypothetical protein A4G30_16190 [Mycobacterium kansasii]